jgi:hypothetical protein
MVLGERKPVVFWEYIESFFQSRECMEMLVALKTPTHVTVR